MSKFTWGDIVWLTFPGNPREKAWVVAVLEDREFTKLPEIPPGTAYTVEVEGGDAFDVAEAWLSSYGD